MTLSADGVPIGVIHSWRVSDTTEAEEQSITVHDVVVGPEAIRVTLTSSHTLTQSELERVLADVQGFLANQSHYPWPEETWMPALARGPAPESLDRPLNYDPDHPMALQAPHQGDEPTHGMTLDDLLGDEVAELIRANKLP